MWTTALCIGNVRMDRLPQRRRVQPPMPYRRRGQFCIRSWRALYWFQLRRILYRTARSSCQIMRELNVNFDTQSLTQLQLKDVVEVSRSRYTVPFLHPAGHSHYATLRNKLGW